MFGIDEAHGLKNSAILNTHAGAVEAALLTHAEQNPDDRVDMVAHSVGAIAALAAAIKHPEKIRSIVLLNPVGFSATDNALRNFLKLSKVLTTI